MGLAGGTPRVEALARPPLPRSSAGTERFRPQGGGVQLSLTVRSRKLPSLRESRQRTNPSQLVGVDSVE